MLDNSNYAGTGVVAGTVVLQNAAMSLQQEIGELIMFDNGLVEMNLIAVPVSTDDVLLEFDVPVVAGTRPLTVKIKAPSRDVSIVVGQVEVSGDQTGQISLKAIPTMPMMSFCF